MTLRATFLAIPLTTCIAATALAQDTELFSWSGQLANGAVLSIRHFNGPIDVRESTTGRVEFRADPRSRRGDEVSFEVENTADGVRICSVYRERNACDNSRGRGSWGDGPPSTRLTVMIPKGVRLDANTGNGDVTVDGAGADVEIRTGNGDVRIRMTAGSVDVSTGNGDLDIDGATGPVRASTGNGPVYVGTATGPVNVRTGNGAIDVRMREVGSGDMSFNTGNGPVTIALPGNYTGEIDASTGRGEFRSDFEIRIVGRLNPQRVRGTIGEGGNRRIRMSSGNGRLELRRIP